MVELSAKEAQPKTKDLGREIDRIKVEVRNFPPPSMEWLRLLTRRTRSLARPWCHIVAITGLLRLRRSIPKRSSGSITTGSVVGRNGSPARGFTWRTWEDQPRRRHLTHRLLNMLKDASAVADVAELEEDQGIAVDDDDAKDVENSEFCKPPPILRAKVMTKTVASAGIQRTSDIKRPAASEPSSQESEEKAQPKKKAKKA